MTRASEAGVGGVAHAAVRAVTGFADVRPVTSDLFALLHWWCQECKS